MSLEELNTKAQGKVYLSKLDNAESPAVIAGPQREVILESGKTIEEVLKPQELFPADLSIRNVVMASAADKAGLKKGDILLSLDGKPLKNFEELRQTLQTIPDGKEVKIGFLTGGKVAERTVLPEVKEIEKKKTKLLGIESGVEYIQPKLIIAKAENVSEAITGAFFRTWDGIVKTFVGYKKLITREVSLNNIGGPLAIGKVASDSLNISLSMFFRLMAIISINLGVINLFPIPVLDGGHIMFLLFEVVNGGPLSRRKLEIAQRFGVAVLFLLIFVALFNDISRLF
jgi:regulator of sigma E protease